MPTAAAARVAAVIPTWNRRDLLVTLLKSLNAQTRPFEEIIVVDNGSTDDSADLAERAGSKVLRLGQNLGFAAAVNRGIDATDADWVAILNNDVTLEPDWLANLLEAAALEDTWFATGKILRAGNPSLVDGTFDEVSRGACASRCGSGKPDGPVWNQPRRIRLAPMTAAIFKRQLFRDLGGLDESFGSYMEDVDFGLRCALAGREGLYVPSAVAYHRGSATLGSGTKTQSGASPGTRFCYQPSTFTVNHGGRLWPDSCSGDCSPCGTGADGRLSAESSQGCGKPAG